MYKKDLRDKHGTLRKSEIKKIKTTNRLLQSLNLFHQS